MASGASKRGVGRARRKVLTIAELMRGGEAVASAMLEAVRQNPEYSFFRRWGFPLRELVENQRAFNILCSVHKLWPRLTVDQRRMYLQTAQRIAEAEQAKIKWNPKASRERSICLAKSAVAAAELVRDIKLIFPPPWVGEKAAVGELVFGLASYISGTWVATFPWDRDDAVDTASGLLRTTKKKIARKAGGMRWELLRELVWLASGGTREPDERTVRRYLEKQRPAKDSAEAYWQSKLDLMGNAFRLAKQWRAQPEVVEKLGPPHTMPETGEPILDTEPFASIARSYL